MQHEHTNNGYLDAKVDGIDTRLTDHMKNVNLRFDGVDRRFDELREDNHKDNEDIKERISAFSMAVERLLTNYVTKEKVDALESRVASLESENDKRRTENEKLNRKWAWLAGIGTALGLLIGFLEAWVKGGHKL